MDLTGDIEMLEDCWFFQNLLHKKPRMVRSLSDPCTSSNMLVGKSYEETYASIKKGKERGPIPRIARAPSDPARSKPKKLLRAPSLPTTLQDDEEVEFSMGKLIRQASMNYSDMTLPPKDLRPPSAGRRKYQPELDNKVKSFKELEFEELRGFKDLRLEEKNRRRGYLCETPVPLWGGGEEDIKAQIKFWARAVASNVR